MQAVCWAVQSATSVAVLAAFGALVASPVLLLGVINLILASALLKIRAQGCPFSLVQVTPRSKEVSGRRCEWVILSLRDPFEFGIVGTGDPSQEAML